MIAYSVYHRREGFYEDIAEIMKLFEGYNWFFRLHSFHGTGAFVYAIPTEGRVKTMQYEVQKLKDKSIKINILQNLSNGVFLYGAGFVGKWSVTYLEKLGIKIIGFIDSDKRKWGKTIAGKTIFSPEDTAVINAKIILITSRHAVPNQEAIGLFACTYTVLTLLLFIPKPGGG